MKKAMHIDVRTAKMALAAALCALMYIVSSIAEKRKER